MLVKKECTFLDIAFNFLIKTFVSPIVIFILFFNFLNEE